MTKKTYVFFSHLEEANILKIFEYQIFLFVFYSPVSQIHQGIDLILPDSQPLTIFHKLND